MASILIQTSLPDELRRFAPFCMAIPIILLAVRYGWQGALLATLLNSVAPIAAHSGTSKLKLPIYSYLFRSNHHWHITGPCGSKAKRSQFKIAQRALESKPSRQLITAEESVRRDIARELHDEIGQNITAIRTQAALLSVSMPLK